RPVVGLMGRLAPRPVDLARVRERLRRLPTWSRDPLLVAPRGLAMLHVGDLDAVRALFAHAPATTDDRPVIEFLAPRATRMTAAGDKDWFTGEALAAFFETVGAHATDAFLPGPDDVGAARAAGNALYR